MNVLKKLKIILSGQQYVTTYVSGDDYVTTDVLVPISVTTDVFVAIYDGRCLGSNM